MQGRRKTFFIDETNTGDSEGNLVEEDFNINSGVEDIANMVCGYVECMSEAIRYLTEVENYPSSHPAVVELDYRLSEYKRKFIQTAILSRACYSSNEFA